MSNNSEALHASVCTEFQQLCGYRYL